MCELTMGLNFLTQIGGGEFGKGSLGWEFFVHKKHCSIDHIVMDHLKSQHNNSTI